jgi:preprotein translocase SecE subunit
MSFTQYLKDTQGELRHVAWPTQTQTIVYTVFVMAVSVGTALYLGLFDFLFTTSLSRIVEGKAGSPIEVTQQPVSSTTPVIVPRLSTTTPGLK